MDILPIFLLRFGVQPSYVDGLFGLPGDLGGILMYDVKNLRWRAMDGGNLYNV